MNTVNAILLGGVWYLLLVNAYLLIFYLFSSSIKIGVTGVIKAGNAQPQRLPAVTPVWHAATPVGVTPNPI